VVTQFSSAHISGASSNPGATIAQDVFCLIQERFELVSTLDPQSVVPRFEDSGIPRAIQEYLGQLVRACSSRQQVLEHHADQEDTRSPALGLRPSDANIGATPHPTTPVSLSQLSGTGSLRTGPVTPLEEEPSFRAAVTSITETIDSGSPVKKTLDISSR
jgi:hypothetical protein